MKTRASRAPSRSALELGDSAVDAPTLRVALFAPAVETGARFCVDSSVRKHTAEVPARCARTVYEPASDVSPCVVRFGVVQSCGEVRYDVDETGERIKLQSRRNLRLVADLRHRRRGELTTSSNVPVETFIAGEGFIATIDEFAKMSRRERFRFIAEAIRQRFPRRLRCLAGELDDDDDDDDDSPPCNADAAVAWLLRQPHALRDSLLLVEFDRDTIRKPSYPYRVVCAADSETVARTLSEAEFADVLGWRPPPVTNLDAFFKLLDSMKVDLSGIDRSNINYLCFEFGSGWANVSLALAEVLGDDVLCVAVDLEKDYESPAAKQHPRVIVLNEDIWEAQFLRQPRVGIRLVSVLFWVSFPGFIVKSLRVPYQINRLRRPARHDGDVARVVTRGMAHPPHRSRSLWRVARNKYAARGVTVWRSAMGASTSEYVTYVVAAFLACVSRVRRTFSLRARRSCRRSLSSSSSSSSSSCRRSAFTRVGALSAHCLPDSCYICVARARYRSQTDARWTACGFDVS